MSWFWVVCVAGAAGVLGGLLGVGGSTVLIPGWTAALGRNLHLYQAAAMAVNVVVAVGATLRHRRAGVLVPVVLRWMIPAAVAGILAGVLLSNSPVFRGAGAAWLSRGFSVFLIYVAWMNLRKLLSVGRPGGGKRDTPVTPPHRHLVPGSLVCGLLMGLAAGLLGIGGGALAVPLQQRLLGLPLRSAIGNSSAVMCVSAAAGAWLKNTTLPTHSAPGVPLFWWSGLLIAAVAAPLAFLGARLGARWTHTLPLPVVRGLYVVLMLLAAWRMW